MRSLAPLGPELDADVVRCCFGGDAAPHWLARAFSTNPADAMALLEFIAIGATVTISWVVDEDASGESEIWTVDLEGTDPDEDPWVAEGEGRTLLEAICRAATDMRDDEDQEGGA